ncbi:MAG TPA: ATP-binding protein, partial [Gaiellaceae bacterium]|nr:ATP-binding protein [Gaiellaceae bacterium]
MSANPFRYGAVARGEYFTDRQTELRALLDDVRGGQDIVIFSPRRFGKTSLVTRAIEQLREEGMLVAYLDLLGAPSKAELADDLGQALYEGLQSPLEQALDRIRDFFSSLTISPRITVGDDAKPQLEFIGYEPERDVDKLIEGLLELPARVARDGHQVVVVFDEFQEIAAIDEHLPGQIRAAFQQQAEIAHVYLGSKRHLMEPMFMERGSALYRSAKPMPL